MENHPQVIHSSEFIQASEKLADRFNDWLAGHLSWLFGLAWTIWVFFIYPLLLLVLPPEIQSRGFFLSSGWIQLWALPLFVYVGNKLQKTTDAQSDAIHQALTHIANVEDKNTQLLQQLTELLEQNSNKIESRRTRNVRQS